jgi:hypothetical protein
MGRWCRRADGRYFVVCDASPHPNDELAETIMNRSSVSMRDLEEVLISDAPWFDVGLLTKFLLRGGKYNGFNEQEKIH